MLSGLNMSKRGTLAGSLWTSCSGGMVSAREGERSGTIWTTPEGERGVVIEEEEEEEVDGKRDKDDEGGGGEKESGEERSGTMEEGALDNDPLEGSLSAFWTCCVSTLSTVSSFFFDDDEDGKGVSERELVIGFRWTMGERGGEVNRVLGGGEVKGEAEEEVGVKLGVLD